MSIVPSVAAVKYQFLSSTMCKNVSEGQCLGETHSFDAKDERAYVLFRVAFTEVGEMFANAEWYYQSGSAEHTSFWWDDFKRSTYIFWGPMNIKGDSAADMRGFWDIEIYLEDELVATEEFTIGPYYQVRVDVSGVPESVSVPVKVDGESYGSIKEGEVKKLGFAPGSSHKLTVAKEIPGSPGIRYTTRDDTWQFSGEGTHSFTYEEQYQLSILTEPKGAATISGDGWYAKGATANIGQIPETIDVGPGERYVRKAIVVDDQEVSTPPSSMTMDKPHTIRVQYQKQYYLTINSPHGNPQGAGWYDADSKVTFSVQTPSGFIIQYRFVAWKGDYTGTGPSGEFVIRKATTIEAVWQADYTQLIILVAIVAAVAGVLLFVRRRRGAVKISEPAPLIAPTAPPLVAVPTEPVCANCGAAFAPGANFCEKCGAQL